MAPALARARLTSDASSAGQMKEPKVIIRRRRQGYACSGAPGPAIVEPPGQVPPLLGGRNWGPNSGWILATAVID